MKSERMMNEQTKQPNGKPEVNLPVKLTALINALGKGDLSVRDKVIPEFINSLRNSCTIYYFAPADKILAKETGSLQVVPVRTGKDGKTLAIMTSTTNAAVKRFMCVGLIVPLRRMVELALDIEQVTDLCIFGDETSPIWISRPTLQKCLDVVKAEEIANKGE